MMKQQVKWIGSVMMLVCAIALGATATFGQPPQRPQRDGLSFLKRAINEANAPTLTTAQETALNNLITAYKDAQPDDEDTVLEAARDAYNAAVLAGRLEVAQAQATIIANRMAVLNKAHLDGQAKFAIDVLTILNNGGKLEPLKNKFGERVLGIVYSLTGHGGGHGGDGGRGPGGGPGGGRP